MGESQGAEDDVRGEGGEEPDDDEAGEEDEKDEGGGEHCGFEQGLIKLVFCNSNRGGEERQGK